MGSEVRRPVILDKDTDDSNTRRLKDTLRAHIDDFLDLAETQPRLVEDWKNSPTTDEHGRWQSDEDCAEAERIRVAAYSHYMARHPDAPMSEVSLAYHCYSVLARGRWVDRWE